MNAVKKFDDIIIYKLNDQESLVIKDSMFKSDSKWPIAENPRYIVADDGFYTTDDDFLNFDLDIRYVGFYGAFETYREAYFFIKLDSALSLLNHVEWRTNAILGNDSFDADAHQMITKLCDSLDVDYFSLPDQYEENKE